MKPRDVDSYIASFPRDVQTLLKQIRRTIRSAAPEASEVLSYNIPAYLQFPYDQPLPLALVSRIVRYKVKQNKAKR